MGFISNINIRNVLESLANVRKNKIVQKASSSRLVKVIPTALKKTFRKHFHKMTGGTTDNEHIIEADHFESGSIISLVSTGGAVESCTGIDTIRFQPDGLLHHNGSRQEAITTATDTTADNIVTSNTFPDVQSSNSNADTDCHLNLSERPFHRDESDQEHIVTITNTATDDTSNRNKLIDNERSESNIAIDSIESIPKGSNQELIATTTNLITDDDIGSNNLIDVPSMKSDVDVELTGCVSQEIPHRDQPSQEDVMTVANTVENNAISNNDLISTHSQEVTNSAGDNSGPMPEAAWFRSTRQPIVQLNNTQETQDSGLSTNASIDGNKNETSVPMTTSDPLDNHDTEQTQANGVNIAEDVSQLSENLMNFIDPSSNLQMSPEKELLVAKCIDSSADIDEWVPISEGFRGQNYAVRYLPTIIHENKKSLSKFVGAFRDDPDNREIFRSLKLAEIAFESLEKHFKEAGMDDCVVEFLKPANHPKRLLEELQRARREYQLLWKNFQELARDHEDLQGLLCRRSAQPRDSEGTASSSSSEVKELKRQVEELKAEREKAEFFKTIDEIKHKHEVAELKKRLQEVEWRRLLTPQQVREEALKRAFQEIDDLKVLYAGSCDDIVRLCNELDLAQEYGLEIGTIADLAERMDQMRRPTTVWSPPADWITPFPEPSSAPKSAAQSKAADDSWVGWTDDSEIF